MTFQLDVHLPAPASYPELDIADFYQDFLKFAREHNYNPILIDALDECPDIFVLTTPRGWEMVNDALAKLDAPETLQQGITQLINVLGRYGTYKFIPLLDAVKIPE